MSPHGSHLIILLSENLGLELVLCLLVVVVIRTLCKGFCSEDAFRSAEWSLVCGVKTCLLFMRFKLFTVLQTVSRWLFAVKLSCIHTASRLPTRRWQSVRSGVTFTLLYAIIELIVLLELINWLAYCLIDCTDFSMHVSAVHFRSTSLSIDIMHKEIEGLLHGESISESDIYG